MLPQGWRRHYCYLRSCHVDQIMLMIAAGATAAAAAAVVLVSTATAMEVEGGIVSAPTTMLVLVLPNMTLVMNDRNRYCLSSVDTLLIFEQ